MVATAVPLTARMSRTVDMKGPSKWRWERVSSRMPMRAAGCRPPSLSEGDVEAVAILATRGRQRQGNSPGCDGVRPGAVGRAGGGPASLLAVAMPDGKL